jgi:hypothetical protein
LMNNALVVSMAEAFALRLQHEVGTNTDLQIRRAYVLALGREASQEDLALSGPFIQEHGLAAWARVLFNTNQLLYVR